jgi:hypothetical protein
MIMKNKIQHKSKVIAKMNKPKNEPPLSDEEVTTPGWPV